MTNEEALKRMKWTKGRTGITSEEAEAIGYAIEKLSNSDEDCISRAEALKNLALINSKDDVYRMINSLPSVQPKSKTDVLDKIKAEIFNACSDNYHMPVYKLSCDEIFEIIDKYKAEKE